MVVLVVAFQVDTELSQKKLNPHILIEAQLFGVEVEVNTSTEKILRQAEQLLA